MYIIESIFNQRWHHWHQHLNQQIGRMEYLIKIIKDMRIIYRVRTVMWRNEWVGRPGMGICMIDLIG